MKLRSLLLLTLGLLPVSASALSVQTDENVARFEQAGDLYQFGNSFTLTAPFTGDIFAAGQTVTIDEPVQGDVQAAGETVIINTTVSENVRIAGSTIIIRGTINGSVLAMGADILIQEGSLVRGDVTALGGKVQIEGEVAGDVFLRADHAAISEIATIGGSVDIRSEDLILLGTIGGDAVMASGKSFIVSDKTRISGNMAYWNPNSSMGPELDPLVAGTLTYDEKLKTKDPDTEKAGALAFLAGIISLFSILSAAFVLLVFIPLLPKLQIDAAKHALKHPWHSLLMALLFFIGMPIIAVVLMITVFGIPLGIITIFKFIAGLLLARVLASLVLVRALEIRWKKKWNGFAAGALALVCFILLHLLNLIPVIGWIVSTALILIGYGALITTGWEKIRKVL